MKIAHVYPFSPQVLNYSDLDWETSQVPLGANVVLGMLNTRDGMCNEIWNYTQSRQVLDRTAGGLRFLSFPRSFNFLPARVGRHPLNGFNRECSRAFEAYLSRYPQDLLHVYGLFHKRDARVLASRTPYVMEHMGGDIVRDPAKVGVFRDARAVIFSATTFLNQYRNQYSLDNGICISIPTDCELFQPAQSQPSIRQMVFVGQIYKEKGVLEAVEVLKGLHDQGMLDVRLAIVGKVVNQSYWNQVLDYIKHNRLEQHVNYLGYIQDKHRLAEIYRQSVMLIFPSYKESFGQVVIEAMACGLPPLVLKGSMGPEDIITQGVDGVVSSRHELLQSAQQLLADQSYRARLGSNGRVKVQPDFTIERRYATVKELYLSCT